MMVVIGALCVLATIFGINSYIDPFADFFYLTGWRPHSIVRIDNYADVKFKSGLLTSQSQGSVDAAVFGSSRVLRINSEAPGFKELGKHTVNFAIQGASLATLDAFVREAIRKHPQMLVIIGLDFFTFGKDANPVVFYLDKRQSLRAWQDSLLRLIDVETLKESLKDPARATRHRILADGNTLFLPSREEMEKVPAYLIDYSRKKWLDLPAYKNFSYAAAQIEPLKLLQKEHPNIIFFINPESKWYQMPLENSPLAADIRQWKNNLRALRTVIDFSGCREITDNPAMYLDEHHYLAPAGDLIMEDIANAEAGRPLRHGKMLQPNMSAGGTTP